MGNLLEGLELYKAGACDVKLAQQRATDICLASTHVMDRDYARVVREEFDKLCQLRIARGELPAPVEATTEAA